MRIALALWLLLFPAAQEPEELEFPARIDNRAPAFSLYDLEGRPRHSRTFEGRAGLLFFFATIDDSRDALARLKCTYANRDVEIVLIDVTKDVHTSVLRKRYAERKLGLTVLLDEQEVVARRYGIRDTPAAYLIDRRGVIRYRGDPGKPLRRALDEVLAGKAVTVKEATIKNAR
jgi:peroxiredoxin